MKYFSIDLETTGTNENLHQIIEFAAIFEDAAKQLPFSEIPKFHRIIKPEGDIIGSVTALNMNSRILNILANEDSYYDKYEISSLSLVIQDFADWVREQLKIEHYGKIEITCAGKNFGVFDKKFLEINEFFNDRIRIKNRILDPALLYTNIIEDEDLPNTEFCMKRAGIELKNEHHALYDAWNVIQLLRKKYHLLNGQ